MNQPHHFAAPQRWSLPRGQILLRALGKNADQEYLLYIPTSGLANASVLVSIHGITRNAAEQARLLSVHCEQRNALLIVPVFEKDTHDDYQRLGRKGRGVRADLAMNRVLDEVARLTGIDVAQTCLLGFSGGAQFVHRYLMVHPHRVRHATIIAAGWYTYPDHTTRYPYGIRHHRALPGVNFNPEQFLRVPMEVVVGEKDIGTSNVRRTKRVDKQQGSTRTERARNWVAAMRAAAQDYGIEPRVVLHEVAKVDHSFAALCASDELMVALNQMIPLAIPPRTADTTGALPQYSEVSRVELS